jgi:hypothetical protein
MSSVSGLKVDYSTGFVGIGTTLPNTAFQIRTNTTTPGTIIDQVGTGAILDIRDAGSSKVIVDGNGNVGIGTTLPTAKLEIFGEVKSSKYLFSGFRTSEFYPTVSTTGLYVPYYAINGSSYWKNYYYYEVPVSGFYFIAYNYLCYGSTSDLYTFAQIRDANGNNLRQTDNYYRTGSGGYDSLGLTCILYAYAGERIYIWANRIPSGTSWLHGNNGNICIYLLN